MILRLFNNHLIKSICKTLLSRSFIQKISFFLLATFISTSLSFITLPIYTRILDLRSIGIIETFSASSIFFTSIILFGTSTIILKDYWRLDKNNFISLVSNAIIFQSAVFVALISIFFLLYLFLPDYLSKLGLSFKLLTLAMFIGFSVAINALFLSILQIKGNAFLYFILVVGRTLLDHILSISLMVIIKPDLVFRLQGLFVSNLIFGLLVLFLLKKEGASIRLNITKFIYILKVGGPLVFSGLAGWGLQLIDRFMINGIKNIEDTGLYSVAYKFGLLVMLFDQSVGRVSISYFMKNISKKDLKINKQIVKWIYFYFLIFLLGILFYSFFIRNIMNLLLDSRYHSAYSIAIIICYSYFFDSIWRVGNMFLIYHNKTKTYSFIVVCSAILNVILNYIYIKKMGAIGAAWATFYSMMFGGLLTFALAIKFHDMPWLTFYRLNKKKVS